jgi:hypothetical protein
LISRGQSKWGDAFFCSYSSGAWEITLFGRPRDITAAGKWCDS